MNKYIIMGALTLLGVCVFGKAKAIVNTIKNISFTFSTRLQDYSIRLNGLNLDCKIPLKLRNHEKEPITIQKIIPYVIHSQNGVNKIIGSPPPVHSGLVVNYGDNDVNVVFGLSLLDVGLSLLSIIGTTGNRLLVQIDIQAEGVNIPTQTIDITDKIVR